MAGYNRGDAYEEKIEQICRKKGILPLDFSRAGAGSGADIIFVHHGNKNILEVKADLKADYGQRKLNWSNGLWTWAKKDEISDFYTKLGILDNIQQKNIIPLRYTKQKDKITLPDRDVDRRLFEEPNIPISTGALFDYYEKENTYYMQIGGYGFYHLSKDPLCLGTPQFDGFMSLRLRAKTHHSFPPHAYSFFAVLKVGQPPTCSIYDLEELDGRKFPPIKP